MKKIDRMSAKKITLLIAVVLFGCSTTEQPSVKRFFADDSFWNQPLPENVEIDPQSDRWIAILKNEPGANAIYAQGLYDTSPVNWKGKLRSWESGIISIPVDHYRVVKIGEVFHGGLNSQELDRHYFKVNYK